MKIAVVGTRGIPNIPGGVETHCEELYPRLAVKGHNITVFRRSCYVTEYNKTTEFKGVKIKDIYSPKIKSIEAIVHTFLSVLAAKRMNPDILHIHAIGPSLMVPFARLLGLKVVMTNHGPDYNRDKWGGFAKIMLKFGERIGTKFSNQVISISQTISDLIATKYGRKDVNLIPNGVNKPVKSHDTTFLQSKGVIPGEYIIAVGRLVKEKGFHNLIEAWQNLDLTNKPQLVIAGDVDHEDEYSHMLKDKARMTGTIMTGFIKGEELNQFMSHAKLFVLPSYHEGLPIALLEALSYNLDVIVSDIPANRLQILKDDDFFHVDDINDLSTSISRKLKQPTKDRIYDLSGYDWDAIASATENVYLKMMNTK